MGAKYSTATLRTTRLSPPQKLHKIRNSKLQNCQIDLNALAKGIETQTEMRFRSAIVKLLGRGKICQKEFVNNV